MNSEFIATIEQCVLDPRVLFEPANERTLYVLANILHEEGYSDWQIRNNSIIFEDRNTVIWFYKYKVMIGKISEHRKDSINPPNH